MSGINGIIFFLIITFLKQNEKYNNNVSKNIYPLCQTADCFCSCYFTTIEKQCKNNISFLKKLYNRLVSLIIQKRDATKPNCGKLRKYNSTTFSWKLEKGTRVMTDPNGNNVLYWKIRNQNPKILNYCQNNVKIMDKAQRLDGFAFLKFKNVRYSPNNFDKKLYLIVNKSYFIINKHLLRNTPGGVLPLVIKGIKVSCYLYHGSKDRKIIYGPWKNIFFKPRY